MGSKLAHLLGSRTIFAVSVAVFVASVLLLPVAVDSASSVGSRIYFAITSHSGWIHRGPDDRAFFRRDGETFVFVPEHEVPIDHEKDAALLKVEYWHSVDQWGWWAPTEQWESMWMYLDDKALNLPNGGGLRQSYVDHLAKSNPDVARCATQLAAGDFDNVTVRWMGWLHNGVSLIACLAIMLSAGVMAKNAYRSRLVRKGLCHKCRYDRSGLAADALCPECGAAQIKPAS
jgi:hypothetical protein